LIIIDSFLSCFLEGVSMADVHFTCTATVPGKKGILPVDENGYYTHIVGGLDVFNSAGELYVYEGAKKLFEQSSLFMRRVKSGELYSEAGHPIPLPGQSYDSYATRVMTVDEKCIAAHISDVWLDFDSVRDESGKRVIAIFAKIKPMGPYGQALKEALDNPKINTCFSIRSFTIDKTIGGVLHRTLDTVVTFDWVCSAGIKFARKFTTPSLEMASLYETNFKHSDLMRILKGKKTAVSMESSKQIIREIIENRGWHISEDNLPAYSGW
jgi:hypothetical protein